MKKRRVEATLQSYMDEIREEREITKRRRIEDRDREEATKADRRRKRSTERAERHADRMKMQQALANILKSLAPVKK